MKYLSTMSEDLAKWIGLVIDEVHYKFDRPISKLPKENEIEVNPPSGATKRKIFRKGLPQGLSVSPILATMVLDSYPKLEGLVMYADDGLIIREKPDGNREIEKWFEELAETGIIRDQKKSGPVSKTFKFLGVTFDLEREEVKYKESTYS